VHPSTQTLNFFFGTDNFSFTIDSKIAGLTKPVRSYNSFSQALDEVRDARVYGGMHYRNSAHKGAILGQQVSRFVTAHFFIDTSALTGVDADLRVRPFFAHGGAISIREFVE